MFRRSQPEKFKGTMIRMILPIITPVILLGIGLHLSEPIVYPAYMGAVGVLLALSLKYRLKYRS